ncbi:amidase family protein [Vibrio sp.]|nr:amidase family protein [Vibrio sp.]
MNFNDRSIYCQQGPFNLKPSGRGSLNGLSFVFKDLFDVEGYTTGAGNPTWLETHPSAASTSSLITRLLTHGAEGIARVQTDELAYSLNGQNIHYGTPVNPKAEDCLPGGSSSGSAVVVASGVVDFAIGTDTGGSVRVPASYCGIYGLRPSLGNLSLDNAFTLSESFDTAGIMARDLSVLRKVYQALADNVETRKVTSLNVVDAFVSENSRLRTECIENKAKSHNIPVHHIDDKKLLSNLSELSEIFRTIQGFEIIQEHSQWLDKYEDSLDPAIAVRVKWAREITFEQYEDGRQKQAAFRQSLIDLLEGHGGVIILPTTPAGPPKLSIHADELAQYRSQLMGLTAIAGLSGCPQLHLPVLNQPEGPCGISLLGLPGSELSLIDLGIVLVENEEGL